MNAQMQALVTSAINTIVAQPTIKHGWATVYATAEEAALAHDPCAVLRSAPHVNDEWQHSAWKGAKQEFVIRAWLEYKPFSGEPVVEGYLYDAWSNSQYEYEGIIE